jgi:hypothetical protein
MALAKFNLDNESTPNYGVYPRTGTACAFFPASVLSSLANIAGLDARRRIQRCMAAS